MTIDAAVNLALSVFTEIIVLVYPGVSATILSVFVYDSNTHYEQDAAVNSDPSLYRILQQDSTIDFDDDLSKAIRIYADVMICEYKYAGVRIFVYPIGVVVLLVAGTSLQRTSKGSRPLEQGVREILVVAAHVVQHRYKPASVVVWVCSMELVVFVGLSFESGYRGASVSVSELEQSSSFAKDATVSFRYPKTKKLPSWDLELSEEDFIPFPPPNSPTAQQQVALSTLIASSGSNNNKEEKEAENTVDDASHVDNDVLSLKNQPLSKT
ncbi:Hypothetical Protein FCC1311_102552 [Hondaea fermentalgiana]|uniref:Uncharacterized protein n=1 Tax=Hondaea fermentalgiana TaxID=2315210 RepID=A0A2R5GT46_9STRA|nr:Hypothetical Protein FCC1311_102552 [Hondaea fermentalgiana]|eukprot:GBG34032.1 Hypothetical Protein FCC1311_102552 [Hondaea fermentalgiana]